MSDVPDWAVDAAPAPAAQANDSSVPDWATSAPAPTKPAPIRQAPVAAPQSKPSKARPTRTAPVGGKIYQLGDAPTEQWGLDDDQAKQAQDYQNYVMNNSVQSNLSPDKEAEVVMAKFPALFGGDPNKAAAHKKEISGAVRYYRNGGTLPIQFNVNESDLPQAITVTANKDEIKQYKDDQAKAAADPTVENLHEIHDAALGIGEGLSKSLLGAAKFAARAQSPFYSGNSPIADNIQNYEDEHANSGDRAYYTDNGNARSVGNFVGENAALLPLNELAPVTKLLGAGKLASMGDLAAQGTLLEGVNSGGEASGMDLARSALLTSLLGVVHGEGGKFTDRPTTPEDVATLEQYGVKPEDLPEGVEPSKVADTINNAPEPQRKEWLDLVDNLQKKTADEQAAPEIDPDEVAGRLTESLNKAGKVRPDQEALYKAERAKRIAQVRDIPQHIQGRERHELKKQILSGELPKAQFEEVGSQFTPEEIDALHGKIETTLTDEFDKVTAERGLEKLLAGHLPTPKELDLLGQVYDKNFVKAALKNRTAMQKTVGAVENFAGSLKSLAATLDLSAPLRQGSTMMHRKEYWSAFLHMFKYATSTKAFTDLENSIKSSNMYPLMKESGLFLAEHGHSLDAREEQFMDAWFTKLPLIKHSDQAYTGFLNKLRADTFSNMVAQADKAGVEINHKDLAKWINVSTGRGSLGSAEKYAVGLNNLLFSPRFLSSRITMLNPRYYMKLDPMVRKEAIKSLAVYGALVTTAVELAKAGGFETSLDPRDNKNFLKITVGNNHFDLGAGFGQVIRLATSLSLDTWDKGKSLAETGSLPKTKYGEKTEGDTVMRFVRSKLSPLAATLTDFYTGSTMDGEPVTVKKEVISKTVPLFLQDYAGVVEDEGLLKGSALSVPALFGVGVQTYGDKSSPKPVPAPPGTVVPDWGKEADDKPIEAKQKVSEANSPDWAKEASRYETSGNAKAVHLAESLGLHINDAGIRSIGEQRYYYEHYRGTARPGTSPHGDGRAIDIRPSRDMTPDEVKAEFEAKGYKGVKIITKLHGTGPHWHVQWDSYKEAA